MTFEDVRRRKMPVVALVVGSLILGELKFQRSSTAILRVL